MSCCKTVLCIIDPDRRGEQVLVQAAAQAGRLAARLAVAHFVDHHTGFESDHVPFITPTELNEALAKAAVERIRGMCERVAPEAAVWVEVADPRRGGIELATSIEAMLVIVGAHNPCGFATGQANKPPGHLPFEVLTVSVPRSWNPLDLVRRSRGAPEPGVLGIIQA